MRVVIKPSTVKNKKYTAIFYDGDKKIKTTQFGDSRYEDYTQHKDKTRRDRYRTRHKKDLETGDYMKAGFLSYYILWGDSSNIKTNISKYKKRFNLK
tara:strand:- start:2489 stop:2779 length:291 start_codon:yes stop_codon:yes gene_type:complete